MGKLYTTLPRYIDHGEALLFGVPGGRHDTRSLWGLYEMYETLWLCLISVSDGAFSVLGLSCSLQDDTPVCLHDCLVVNGTSTPIKYRYLHGTAARVLTSGHPPGTQKHDIVGWKACKLFRYSSDGNRGEAVENKDCITS